ncbi:MAG: DUF1016 family protein [Fibrobacter sp.]|nr:DUF1016 family protein [Fibrobacter sp.]
MAKNIDFNGLCNAIAQIDKAFVENTAKAINKNVTARNWLTGYYIVHYEQNGNDRATYGAKTLQKLAERLNKKSLSYRNLKLYRQFYMEFKNLVRPVLEFTASEFGLNRLLTANLGVNLEALPPVNTDLASADCQIGQTVFAQSEKIEIPPEKLFDHLSYSHFLLIMNVENPLGRVFYELETMKGVWSFRELKRQIDSNYFERTALSKNPAKMSAIVQSRIAQTGHTPALKDLVKNPYVYEFIGLNNKDVVEESDLENALMSHLEEFLLELGNGFCFETRQKRILVDDDYFFCDLVFYHRILKCHVLIDLKATKIKYDDIAQMNLYLAYYRKNVMEKGDNPPVGILMCTKAGKELVEYATAGIEESLFVQKYKLNLPAEDELTRWLKKEVNKKRDTSK